MKNLLPYKLKTYFIGFLLCITFSALQAQEASDSLSLSLDTTKLSTIYVSKANKLFEKVKIPLWKKEGEKRLWVFPAIAWNNYDKTQLGLMFGFQKESKYAITATPLFGLGSKNFTGVFNSWFHVPTKKIYNVVFELNAKRFSYLLFPEDLAFNKINPRITMSHKFKFKGLMNFEFSHGSIWQEYILGGRQTTYFYTNRISVQHHIVEKGVSSKTKSILTQAAQFGTFEIQNNLQYRYKRSNKFYLRTYMGAFLYNSKSSTNIQAPLPVLQLSGVANNGVYWLQKDYNFDDLYLDRNGQDPFFRRQVANAEGGFLSLTSLGNVNSFLFASNAKTDVMLPEKVKKWVNLQPYINFAVGANKNASTEIYIEGGTSLLFFGEILGFHVPFATTNNIKENQLTAYDIEPRDWAKRITFSINFAKMKRGRADGINH